MAAAAIARHAEEMTPGRTRVHACATVAAIAALAPVAAGCGHSTKSPTTTPSRHVLSTTTTTAARPAKAPRPLNACRSAGGGWQALPTKGYYSPRAARLGSGRVGVVFANDSVNDACAWIGEARSLADHGYTVAVFETVASYNFEDDQVLAVAGALRRIGVAHVVVVGASVGARAVLLVAARRPSYLAGAVAMSAERRLGANAGDLLPVGHKIRVPVLSIGSRRDPLTAFGKDTPDWDRTIPHDRMLLLSGDDHGVDFLADRHRDRVHAAILAFVRSVSAGR
jgi:pimeloyl-ACP methyl ester carboxylesterase